MKKLILSLLLMAFLVTSSSLAYITPITAQPQNELDLNDFSLATDEGLYYQRAYDWSFQSTQYLYAYIDTDEIASIKVEVWGLDLNDDPILIEDYLWNEWTTVGRGLLTDSYSYTLFELQMDYNWTSVKLYFYSNANEPDSLLSWSNSMEDSIYLSTAYYYWGDSSLMTEIENAYNLGYTDGTTATQQDVYDNGYSSGWTVGYNEGLTDSGQEAYDEGYLVGYADGEATDYGQSWIITFFGLFDVIFAIELLPGLTIGILTGIVLIPPIALGVIKWLRG